MRHYENDDIPVCQKEGGKYPCFLRSVELNPENLLAWRLYWDTRLSTKDILSQLENIELSECEAEEVAMKIRTLSIKINDLEIDKIKQEANKGAR